MGIPRAPYYCSNKLLKGSYKAPRRVKPLRHMGFRSHNGVGRE
jgi:hypothetical protein